MKTRLSLLLCFGIFLTACSKKKETVTPVTSAIQGTWELRATKYGTLVPGTYAPGNGHLLIFGNYTFTQYTAGALIDKGTYNKSANIVGQYIAFSNFDGNTSSNQLTFAMDTVLFIPRNPEISTGFYVKISADTLAK